MAQDADRLDELVKRPGILVVSWWAPRSPAQAAFAAEFAAAAQEIDGGATFAAVNIDDNAPLAETYGVDEVPTVMTFRDGVLVFRQTGFVPATTLLQIVRATQAMDMADLRQGWDGHKKGVPAQPAPAAPAGTPPTPKQPARRN
jgi:thioredoxin-like negative regulator of GroEL